MKVTVDLPDELYKRAKFLAVEQKTTFREILIMALEKHFESPNSGKLENSGPTDGEQVYHINEAGFVVYTGGDQRRKITKEFLEGLKMELGL